MIKIKKLKIILAISFFIPAYIAYGEELPSQSDDSTKNHTNRLSEIVVESEEEKNQIGYVAKRSTAATKTDTSVIETPQSITVITEQQIRDQGAQSVQDALRYTAGVRGETYGLDSRGDWSTVRGTDPVIFLDGLQQTFGYYASSRPDPFGLEAIEVIKGPSSVLYGQGSVGGIVNLRSKRPQEEEKGEINFQYGSFDRKQIGIDLTGSANKDGTLLYRMVAVGRDSDTQVKQVADDRLFFMPSFTLKPSEQVEWTIMGSYQNDDTGSTTQFLPHSGTVMPAPNNLPRIPIDVFMSEPNFDAYDTTQKSLTSLFNYKLNDTWTLRQNFRYAASSVDYRTIYPAFPPQLQSNGDIDRVFWVAKPDLHYWTIDNHAQADFGYDEVKHKVLIGFDSQYAVTNRTWAYGPAGILNLYNPAYGNFTPPTESDFSNDPKNTIKQLGAYVQDQVTLFDRWIAVGGVRKDWTTNITKSPEYFTKQTSDQITARASLMYKSDWNFSPYISYSESFLPVIGVNASKEQYKPLNGRQYETGIKYQPKNSSSFITAAVFDIEERNRQTPDPADPMNQLQAGKAKSRGFEFEALGQITEDWSLIGNYSYTDTKVAKGTPDYDEGKHLPSVPQNMASLWTQHKFSIGHVKGFRAGAGVRYVGHSWDGTDSLKTPSTTLTDAMVAYDVGNWTFAINGNNLEDEIYYTTCLARGDCFVGTRRTIVGSVSYRF